MPVTLGDVSVCLQMQIGIYRGERAVLLFNLFILFLLIVKVIILTLFVVFMLDEGPSSSLLICHWSLLHSLGFWWRDHQSLILTCYFYSDQWKDSLLLIVLYVIVSNDLWCAFFIITQVKLHKGDHQTRSIVAFIIFCF